MTMTGKNNSAFGLTALQANSAGSFNSAFGNAALAANTAGQSNSAFGNEALQDNKNGVANSAFGAYALLSNTSGGANVAVGDGALTNLQTGGSNIAIGTGAGGELTSENNNIDIGNSGSISESGAIHIGTGGTQTKTFIAGIFSSASAFGIPVLVNNSGQLGTTLSSQRYKEQISDLGAESDVLMKLRPVSFYYKSEYDSTHTRQYGLVAEEVAKIAPDLVVFDQEGKSQTVRYHFVNAMLLNEVQKQRATIVQQQTEIEAIQIQIKELMLRLAMVEKSVQPGR